MIVTFYDLVCSMHLLYQRLKVIKVTELSKATWYSCTFGASFDFLCLFIVFSIIRSSWLIKEMPTPPKSSHPSEDLDKR